MTQQYQVLARKYRPKNFGELIGQDHVATALANAIDHNRLHHAYLFTGTRGVGKTTIARILAKCLNCETGITSTPCGVCATCQAIDDGQFIDLIEIDAASRTKVEDTRELLDNVPYPPTQGRYKVYLIDEVHMLSTHSFNALLKTLEEPPVHVKFLFATTDPQKLPATIISRCLQFVLRTLPQELLVGHLSRVLGLEGIGFSDNALWQLAKSAKGSVRDCLSLTDQAIAFGGGQIDDTTVSDMLGLIDGSDVLALLTDIYQGDKSAVASHIEAMRIKLVDAEAVINRLADSIHQIAMVQVLPNLVLDMNIDERQKITQLSIQIPSDVLQLYYEIILRSKESLKFATTPMQSLEMGILRLLAFDILADNQQISEPMPIVNNTPEAPIANKVQLDHKNKPKEDFQNHLIDNTVNLQLADNAQNKQKNTNEYDINQKDDIKKIPTGVDNSSSNTMNETEVSDNTHQDIIGSLDDSNEVAPNDDNKTTSDTPAQVATNQQTPDDLTLMLLPTAEELAGEWTYTKWDFWVYDRHRQGVLSNDELAMAMHANMSGVIGGEVCLLVANVQIQIERSFKSLKQKYIAEFGGNLMLKQGDIHQTTPYAMQEERSNRLERVVLGGLANSPVLASFKAHNLLCDENMPLNKLKLLLR